MIAVRRGGAIHAFDTINHWFLINEMIVPGSCYWNIGIGRARSAMSRVTPRACETMRTLGRNMAWLLHKLED